MTFTRRLLALLLCSATIDAAADCFVRSGLNYMDDQESVGVVECSGDDSQAQRNVAVAMARTQLSKLTATSFEHTIAENGVLKTSDQFISGFAGNAKIVRTDIVIGNVRYTIEAHLDKELRERMAEGMAKFPGMTHRLKLLENRLKQMSRAGLGHDLRLKSGPKTYTITDEIESIRGTVISNDEIQKRLVEYQLIESGTIEYLKALADNIEVTVEKSDLMFNSLLDRWELKQEIQWELTVPVKRPPWLKVAFVGKPLGRAHIAVSGSKQVEAIFSKVIENYAIELVWENGGKAWTITHPCRPYYKHPVDWGITSCSRSVRGQVMAVRLQALDKKAVKTSDQTARVTAPLASPNDAQNFGRIAATLVHHRS